MYLTLAVKSILKRPRYCHNAFNVKPHFDSSTQERLAQNGTVKDLEERVLMAVQNSKVDSTGDK